MSVMNEIAEALKTERSAEQNAPENPPAEAAAQTTENNAAENPAPEAGNPEVTPTENPGETIAEQHTPTPNAGEPKPENAVSDFATEEVKEMNAYLKKNPGKSITDYQALKVPTESLNEEDLMRLYLSEKEGKGKSSVELEMKRLELKKNSDDDFDDDFEGDEKSLETLEKEAAREELIRKAREWRDGYVQEQLGSAADNQETPAENTQQPAQSIDDFLQDAKRIQEEATQNYRTEIYKAVGEINEIPLQINDTEVKFPVTDEFRSEMRKGAEDVAGIGKEHFDEAGNIKNAKGFITENTLWANPKTRATLLDFVKEQAVMQDRASRDKVQRNINFDNQPHSVEGKSNVREANLDKHFARKNGTF